eukprot:TRINITY_DN8283_c0_g1_i1.p1 TRINITY_DN8283_c0_g1~~TRINITY_DN8283_c0_g1_i1.p1  ORF type:complete len:442 (-),score=101.88 TRINITY_DN8283_c0_g1_i1:87-1337(-)
MCIRDRGAADLAGAMDLDEPTEFAPRSTWEAGEKRSWDDIQEDGSGRIAVQGEGDAIESRRRRRRALASSVVTQANIRKGLIRYMVVIVELSQKGMTVGDDVFRPNRAAAVASVLPEFFREYFDQNPISQLALISTSNLRATKLTDFTGSARKHIAAVKEHVAGAPFQSGGEPSLQNALLMAHDMLGSIPQYGVREVLVLWGALSTVDPEDVFETIGTLEQSQVRCSVISMSAEMHVCRHLCTSTTGSSFVAQSVPHLKELVMAHSAPAACLRSSGAAPEAYLILMGFPCSVSERHKAFCACHNQVKGGGYLCPRCQSKMCDLPSQCAVCGLSLMSSAHLARSYHHLFPVPGYTEEMASLEMARSCTAPCGACQVQTAEQLLLQCPKCEAQYCYDCDAFIHDCLHVCPGCEAKPQC